MAKTRQEELEAAGHVASTVSQEAESPERMLAFCLLPLFHPFQDLLPRSMEMGHLLVNIIEMLSSPLQARPEVSPSDSRFIKLKINANHDS